MSTRSVLKLRREQLAETGTEVGVDGVDKQCWWINTEQIELSTFRDALLSPPQMGDDGVHYGNVTVETMCFGYAL